MPLELIFIAIFAIATPILLYMGQRLTEVGQDKGDDFALALGVVCGSFGIINFFIIFGLIIRMISA